MDEVRDSRGRPTIEVTPNLGGVKAFPYEGKGDRSAVDEVPTQAPDFAVSTVHRFGKWNHRKPERSTARVQSEK